IATFTLKHGDGHTPEALTRNAPVGTRGNHVRDTLFAPRRVPGDLLDLVQRTVAQRATRNLSFHRDEPLLGGAEDDGIVTAPAVRIRMLDFFEAQQHAATLQQLNDLRVRLEHLL